MFAWKSPDRRMAFSLKADGTGGQASISSSFYLLVKYYQMPPRAFVCKGDRGTTEFKLSDRMDVPPSSGLTDAWDFGPPDEAVRHCSYAYHIPYGLYPLSTSLDPKLAVTADRNPWIASPASSAGVWTGFRPDIDVVGAMRGTAEQGRAGNSITHKLNGQNVLFLDGRVTFERRAYCGLDRDNVYTISRNMSGSDPWGAGLAAVGTACVPANRKDSVLVHDPDVFASTTTEKRR
jgi:hypothetical protein